MKILFLSNGYGEDRVADSLIKVIKERKDFTVKVLPLVGKGDIFTHLDVEVLGPVENLPSGGLINNNLSALLQDIKSGLISLTVAQIKTLKKNDFDLIICVGDRYPVILAGLFTSIPLIFVAIAQSVRVSGYSIFEKLLMKQRVTMVFPRDIETHMDLKESDIPSEFHGNPMMDTFSIEPCNIDIPDSVSVVTILPGSRSEIWYNLKISLLACRHIHSLSCDTVFLMALSESVSTEELLCYVQKEGWHFSKDNHIMTIMHGDGTQIKFSQNYFGFMINRADTVLGLGGTANEQAAGMGKPVVTFWSSERQVRPSFIKHQKSLLGDALIIVPAEPELIAGKIIDLLRNPLKAKELGRAGSVSMGERGGVNRIVEYIVEFSEKSDRLKKSQEG